MCRIDEYVERPAPPLPAIAARRSVWRRPAIIAHDLQYLRERLLFAFLAPAGYREDLPPPVRTAPWATDATRDAFPRYRAQELARCEDGDGNVTALPLSYVTDLARETTRVTVTETRPRKKSGHPLPPTAFDDARLVRCVGALSPEYRHWIRYAYADAGWEDEAGAVKALWARVRPGLGKLQNKTERRLKGLAHLAIQHGRRQANCGEPLYAPQRLRELLAVSEANFDQHWRPRWQALIDGVERMDEDGLRLVLTAYRGGKRDVRMVEAKA